MMNGPEKSDSRHSSDEACEQGRSTGCGVGGAKGGDQGERGPPHTRRTQSRCSVSQGLDPCTGRFGKDVAGELAVRPPGRMIRPPTVWFTLARRAR